MSSGFLLAFTTSNLLMLDQLCGVGALAHRGLLPYRGLVPGSFPAPDHHDPNEMLFIFAFGVVVVVREEGHDQGDRSGPRTLRQCDRLGLPRLLGRHVSGVAIETVMAEIDIFASSTDNFNIITLDT